VGLRSPNGEKRAGEAIAPTRLVRNVYEARASPADQDFWPD